MVKLSNLKDLVYFLTLAVAGGAAYGVLSAKVAAQDERTREVVSIDRRLSVMETKVDIMLTILKRRSGQ